jgi:hypothetical protein
MTRSMSDQSASGNELAVVSAREYRDIVIAVRFTLDYLSMVLLTVRRGCLSKERAADQGCSWVPRSADCSVVTHQP